MSCAQWPVNPRLGFGVSSDSSSSFKGWEMDVPVSLAAPASDLLVRTIVATDGA